MYINCTTISLLLLSLLSLLLLLFLLLLLSEVPSRNDQTIKVIPYARS